MSFKTGDRVRARFSSKEAGIKQGNEYIVDEVYVDHSVTVCGLTGCSFVEEYFELVQDEPTEEVDEYADLRAAEAEGKIIQTTDPHRYTGEWIDAKCKLEFNMPVEKYRIKYDPLEEQYSVLAKEKDCIVERMLKIQEEITEQKAIRVEIASLRNSISINLKYIVGLETDIKELSLKIDKLKEQL